MLLLPHPPSPPLQAWYVGLQRLTRRGSVRRTGRLERETQPGARLSGAGARAARAALACCARRAAAGWSKDDDGKLKPSLDFILFQLILT